jgi:hypothetical protein
MATGSVAQAKTERAGATEDAGNIFSGREDPGGPQSGIGRAAYKAMDCVDQKGNELVYGKPNGKVKLSEEQRRLLPPIAKP